MEQESHSSGVNILAFRFCSSPQWLFRVKKQNGKVGRTRRAFQWPLTRPLTRSWVSPRTLWASFPPLVALGVAIGFSRGLKSGRGEHKYSFKPSKGDEFEILKDVWVSPLYQDWDSRDWAAPPPILSLPHCSQSGSFLCFRKFRPFHHQFKSFPEISFLGPKAASPFEAPMTAGSSHRTRWVFLVPEQQGLVTGQVPLGGLLVRFGNGHVLAP